MPKPIQTTFDAGAALEAIDRGAHAGLASAARFITDEMRRRAPKQLGHLAESIDNGGVQGLFRAGTLHVTFSAGAPYAAHVEYGTKPHPIEAHDRPTRTGRPSSLRWADGGGNWVYRRKVRHPGTKAQPFFRSSIEDNQEKIAQQVGDAIEKSLTLLAKE